MASRIRQGRTCYPSQNSGTTTPIPATTPRTVEISRTQICWFYADLKTWARDPCPRPAAALRVRLDRIFRRKTDYVTVDRLLAQLHRRKSELLRVLERPEIPLHTNGSENDIRACVTKRKISGGTMSKAGRNARDNMLGLMKTCSKLTISFFHYLGDGFQVSGVPAIPSHPFQTSFVRLQSKPIRLGICPGYGLALNDAIFAVAGKNLIRPLPARPALRHFQLDSSLAVFRAPDGIQFVGGDIGLQPARKYRALRLIRRNAHFQAESLQDRDGIDTGHKAALPLGLLPRVVSGPSDRDVAA